MNYRTLGRTGVEVSELCLGAMMFGDWGNTDEDEGIRIVHAALDAGINFVDTADVYSQGRARRRSARRSRTAATRSSWPPRSTARWARAATGRATSRLWITKGVEDSLRRLQTDHIDLYQIHRPVPSTDLEETLGVLTDLQRQGKINYAGC